MDLRRIADKAKELVGRRGGTESLKEDAAELGEASAEGAGGGWPEIGAAIMARRR